MEDTFESLDDEDLEEEAGEAVEAILFEVTKGETRVMFQTTSSVVTLFVSLGKSVYTTCSWLPLAPLHLPPFPSSPPSLPFHPCSSLPVTPFIICCSSFQANWGRLLLSQSSQKG